MFSIMQFEFPQAKSRYEFRFEPLPGATVIDAFGSQEIFEQLDAANGTQQRIDGASPYGVFQIYYTGRRVAQATILTNAELGGTTKGFIVEDGGTQVTQVEVVDYRVDNGVNTGHGQAHGWRSEVLGFPQQNQGQTKERDIFKGLDNGREIQIRVKANSIYSPGLQSKPGYQPELYGGWIWDRPTFEVISSSGGWQVGDVFTKGYDITSDPVTKNNKFLAHAYAAGYRRIYANFKIVAIGDRTVSNGEFKPNNRIWSGASQVSKFLTTLKIATATTAALSKRSSMSTSRSQMSDRLTTTWLRDERALNRPFGGCQSAALLDPRWGGVPSHLSGRIHL